MSDEQPIQFTRNAMKAKLESEAVFVFFTTYDKLKNLSLLITVY